MERCIDIRLRLSYGPRSVRAWLTCALVVLLAGDLASENVTLTTYYPAPSGVYTQMITTNNTYLARDATSNGGQVTVGSNVSGTGQQIDIYSYKGGANNAALRATYPNGGGLAGTEFSALANRAGFWSALYANQGAASYAGYFNGALLLNNGGVSGNYGFTPGYAGWAAYGTGAGGAAIYNDAGSYKTLMLVGNNSAGGVRQVGVWDQLTVNGNTRGVGNLQLSGSGGNRGYLYVDNSNASCYAADIAGDVWNTACVGGYFITQQPGFYVEGWSYYNRGGQVLVQTGAGQASTQVWGLNNCSGGGGGCTGNPTWMTLKKDDSSAHVWCCLK